MMTGRNELIAIIQEQGVLPLFYHDDPETCIAVVDILYGQGIRAIEFTNRGDEALANFKRLVTLIPTRWVGLHLGIGTVLTVADAIAFIDQGADFVVSPGMITEVGQAVRGGNGCWIPGCLTPTEIMQARQNGARLVKIFPGSLVGPAYITAMKEVFRDMQFMPTGGVEVNEQNIGEWFRAGVLAVGLGSKLISKQDMDKKDYNSIASLVKKVIDIVQPLRKPKTGYVN